MTTFPKISQTPLFFHNLFVCNVLKLLQHASYTIFNHFFSHPSTQTICYHSLTPPSTDHCFFIAPCYHKHHFLFHLFHSFLQSNSLLDLQALHKCYFLFIFFKTFYRAMFYDSIMLYELTICLLLVCRTM